MSGFLTSGPVGDLLNLGSNLKLGPWAWGLKPASWRGLRFAVRESKIRRGRRVVVHEYPFRDEVWVEDLGRGTRVVSFSGFLIGDNVFAQRDAMVAAAETAGTGQLVHPSLGRITAALVEFSAGERADLGRVVELDFSLIESVAQPAFPTSGLATQLAVITSAIQAGLAIASDYIDAVTTTIAAISAGVTFVSNVFATVRGIVSGFVGLAGSVINDSAAAANSVFGLQSPDGTSYGRYSSGTNVTVQPSTATVTTVLAAVTVASAAVTAAGANLAAVVDPQLLPDAAQALTEAVRAVAQDPADQVRILSGLAGYAPVTAGPSTAPVGAAIVAIQSSTVALLRGAALVSIANATATYQPGSYNEAIAMLQAVTALLDVEILAVADAGLTASYRTLRALRAAITQDLLTRAASLPRLREITTAAPMPSLALAYSLYADATRSDELIGRADPISPLFMPLNFRAMSG